MPTKASTAGFFTLRSARDLCSKLEHDYRRIESAPTDAYAAFDFFVTAEHLLDWVYPRTAGKPQRTRARASSILLQICSHVASGAKHFEVEDPRHESVSGTVAGGGYFAPSYFSSLYFPSSYFAEPHLVVELAGKAKMKYGPKVPVLVLAKQLLEYWRKHPKVA
jgi:hypothetical protein